MMRRIGGLRVPGGRVIHEREGFALPGAEHGDVFLTEHFFQQAGWQVPSAAARTRLGEYRYYPEDSQSARAGRGAGRDHIVSEGSREEPTLGAKGSGVNRRFGTINGEFDISDFRRNGLAVLDESLAEYIIAANLSARGAPVAPHEQIVLLPDWIQKRIRRESQGKPEHWTDQLAVQVVRDLSMPRESAFRTLIHEEAGKNPNQPSEGQITRFLGFNYFYNFAHGAINHENVANAHFLDMGHITFGYPVTSGLYRCTNCVGSAGTTGYNGARGHDFWIGALEHYFPQGRERRSYGFDVKRPVARRIVHEMLKYLDPEAAPPQIGAKEHHALTQAFNEALPFSNRIRYEQDILPFAERILGIPLANNRRPGKVSISLRFILQVAALEEALSKPEAARAKRILLRMSEHPEPVRELYDMFSAALRGTSLSRESLRPLYDQDMPTNVLLDRVREKLHTARGMGDVERLSKELIEENTRPVRISPRKFYDAMNEFFAPRVL